MAECNNRIMIMLIHSTCIAPWVQETKSSLKVHDYNIIDGHIVIEDNQVYQMTSLHACNTVYLVNICIGHLYEPGSSHTHRGGGNVGPVGPVGQNRFRSAVSHIKPTVYIYIYI